MMTDRFEPLRNLIQGRSLPMGIMGLANAILPAAAQQPSMKCHQYRRQLPIVADAILAREWRHQGLEDVQVHLLWCDECGRLFGELLDTMIEQLKKPDGHQDAGSPNLSFLEDEQ